MLWYEHNSKGTCISTRVRLARNLSDYPFMSRLNAQELSEMCKMICDAALNCDLGISLRKIEMESLGDIEAYSMVERHCISPKFAANKEGRILLLSNDESVSIMIGEEDHLRIQVLKPGECLTEAYNICNKIETEISRKMQFAYDDALGFLTECPTNLGTGLRASVMLHIPLLHSGGNIRSLTKIAEKIGLTVRGFYGEGSNSKVGFYQISNQVTLGISEEKALENLKSFTDRVAVLEKQALEKVNKSALEDTAFRAFGLLKYARKVSTEEMMQNINILMLGLRADVINFPDDVNLIKMFITLQPSMINRINGETPANERDILRADSLRKIFEYVEP